MNKKKSLQVIIIYISFFLIFNSIFASIIDRVSETSSPDKVLKIEKLMLAKIRSNSKEIDKKFEKKLISQVKQRFPLEEGVKLKKMNSKKIRKKAQKKADKKYSKTRKELRKKYKEIAQGKYSPAKPGTKVKVRYRLGPKIKQVSGVYKGFTHMKNGIKVDNYIVPLFDIIKEDKALFVPKYREIKRENYIQEKIQEYLTKKQEYAQKYMRKAAKKIVDANEKAGYVYAWGKWRTPKELAKLVLDYYKTKLKNNPDATLKPISSSGAD